MLPDIASYFIFSKKKKRKGNSESIKHHGDASKILVFLNSIIWKQLSRLKNNDIKKIIRHAYVFCYGKDNTKSIIFFLDFCIHYTSAFLRTSYSVLGIMNKLHISVSIIRVHSNQDKLGKEHR